MADGYVETGEEVMMALKEGQLVDSEKEAGAAMEQGIIGMIREVKASTTSLEKRIRRAYCAGIFGGLRIAQVQSRLKLRQMRFEEGKDPDTGLPVKEGSDA